jgi:hypothetical protein
MTYSWSRSATMLSSRSTPPIDLGAVLLLWFRRLAVRCSREKFVSGISRLEASGDTECKTAGDFSTSWPSEFLRHSCSSRNSRSIASRRLLFVRMNGCGSRMIAYDFFAVLLNEGSTKQRRPIFSHREHGAGNLSWTLHLTFSCQICRHKSGAICHV